VDWFNATLKSPMGYESYVCRFTEMYSMELIAGLWKITLPLEIFERPLFDENWFLYASEFIGLSDIFDIAMNREWPQS
jgi:hypothetical protein